MILKYRKFLNLSRRRRKRGIYSVEASLEERDI